MSAFYQIFLLLPVAVVSLADHRSQRTKRSLVNLAEAIECSTGRSAARYLFYGCYCGFGGQGRPRDSTDWCCFKHDCCYGKAEKRGCETKTKNYHLTCEDETAECDDLQDKCDMQVCKCDSDFAKCLKKASYNALYYAWPDFFCGSIKPICDNDE